MRLARLAVAPAVDGDQAAAGAREGLIPVGVRPGDGPAGAEAVDQNDGRALAHGFVGDGGAVGGGREFGHGRSFIAVLPRRGKGATEGLQEAPPSLRFSRHGQPGDEIKHFSYAAPDDPRLKRLVIRAIETMTGQPYLKSLYDEHRLNPIPGESFWSAAMRNLELKIAYNEEALGASCRKPARW